MIVREITETDLNSLLKLYTHLHDNEIPEESNELSVLWNEILADRNHHIIVAEENGEIISSCVCVVVPNLTHNQQSYALIENVVTHGSYRGGGLATACLDYAKRIAEDNNCYKIMLMTGSKQDSTLRFYERAGYNRNDKTAFIQWI